MQPTSEQRALISRLPSHTVVFASPGSGKTFTLTEHIGQLLYQGILHPSQIVAITYTRKAAAEMKQRLAKFISSTGVQSIHLGTFHALVFRLLLLLGKDVSVVLSAVEQAQVMKAAIRAASPRNVSTMYWLSELAKCKSHWPIRIDEHEQSVIHRYEEIKRRQHRWDYDDIFVRFLDLAERGMLSDIGKLDFRYILVDEFQDTNPIQLVILKWISNSFQIPVFVVGDDDQAIYGFRGAMPDSFRQVMAHLGDVRAHNLSQNFRSDRCIVKHSQKLIVHNIGRTDKPFRVASESLGICQHHVVPNEQFQAIKVVHHIAQHKEKFPDDTIAVLARTRAQLYEVAREVGLFGANNVFFHTFHEAKGKEWDEVHLLGMSYPNPYVPNQSVRDQFVHLEEERRLVYVAMTRARHRLHVYSTVVSQRVKQTIHRFVPESGLSV